MIGLTMARCTEASRRFLDALPAGFGVLHDVMLPAKLEDRCKFIAAPFGYEHTLGIDSVWVLADKLLIE